MKILFIGGTKFVGRNIVEAAIKEGHVVHILQRGKTNKDLFPLAKKFIGDRDNIDLLIAENEFYDLVVDSCGYHPDQVYKTATFLKNKTNKYIFISTGSVYADFSIHGLNEQSEVSKSEKAIDSSAPITNENYGLLKARCEEVLKSIFEEGKYLILRPCIIVGKYDDTNRFNLLLKKIKDSDELIIPNDPLAHIQFIDVRAIVEFVINSNERHGTYNLIGPSKPIKLIDFIHSAKSILNPDLKITLSDANKLEFPMYVAGTSSYSGFFHFDGTKAYGAGLKKYSSSDTVEYVREFI